jgi:hypothetical protein
METFGGNAIWNKYRDWSEMGSKSSPLSWVTPEVEGLEGKMMKNSWHWVR